MNAWEYIPKPLEITPGLDLRDLEALFHDLTKRYTSFHVDCDHSAPWSTASSTPTAKSYITVSSSTAGGVWPELEEAA